MNHTIGQILHAHLLDKDQEHWPDYAAVTKMAIHSTINGSINKAPFKVLYNKTTLLPVDLLLSRESSINPHVYTIASKMKQLVYNIRNAINDA